jgi:hypothetical protein
MSDEKQEPVAWESTTVGFRKYITDAQYQHFGIASRAWYRPYKCSSCAVPQPDDRDAEIARLRERVQELQSRNLISPATTHLTRRSTEGAVMKMKLTLDYQTIESLAIGAGGYVESQKDKARSVSHDYAAECLDRASKVEVAYKELLAAIRTSESVEE